MKMNSVYEIIYEIRYNREIDIAIQRSFEDYNEKIFLPIRSRIKKHDNLIDTFRCNKYKRLDKTICTICQYEFKSNQICRKTCDECHFHAKCIDQWLINSDEKSCPNCRKFINLYKQ